MSSKRSDSDTIHGEGHYAGRGSRIFTREADDERQLTVQLIGENLTPIRIIEQDGSLNDLLSRPVTLNRRIPIRDVALFVSRSARWWGRASISSKRCKSFRGKRKPTLCQDGSTLVTTHSGRRPALRCPGYRGGHAPVSAIDDQSCGKWWQTGRRFGNSRALLAAASQHPG